MTIKKLTKLGNSQALVLDKSILAQMGLSEAGEVQITLHGQQLVVTPVHPTIPRLDSIIWPARTSMALVKKPSMSSWIALIVSALL